MLRRAATGIARCAHDSYMRQAPVVVSGSRFASGATPSTTPSPEDLQSKNIYTILAEMMHSEAAKAKKQDALKADVIKVLNLMNGDISKMPDMDFKGTLKDMIPTLSKKARSLLFADIMATDTVQKAQPALKNVLAELNSVGETASIVQVGQRYLQMLDGKPASAVKKVTIQMTLAKQEPPKEVEAKKAMLVTDMQSKGMLGKNEQVTWQVDVDASIKGGVVYSIGDLLVDASERSLQDQFFQTLEAAGVKRIC